MAVAREREHRPSRETAVDRDTSGVRVLVVACGALARELAVLTRTDGEPGFELSCLPAELHDTPERIPEAVRERVREARRSGRYDRILVGYADCGTGGRLDAMCAEEGVERLPGAHCYELYAGAPAFGELHDQAPGTFYLTDYLVRHFDRLVVGNLGLDRHPQLRDVYFGNYTRVVYLRQTRDPALLDAAHRAAERLGLPLEVRTTGLDHLADALADVIPSRRLTVVPA